MDSFNTHIFLFLSSLDAAAAENISMTLTELSVFMKKQELELQLRTEKEREEGECHILIVPASGFSSIHRHFVKKCG